MTLHDASFRYFGQLSYVYFLRHKNNINSQD